MAGALFQRRGRNELGFLLTALHADRARTFRIEVAGHDGVDPDLSFSEFERQHLGDGIHRGLGCGIDGAAGAFPRADRELMLITLPPAGLKFATATLVVVNRPSTLALKIW